MFKLILILRDKLFDFFKFLVLTKVSYYFSQLISFLSLFRSTVRDSFYYFISLFFKSYFFTLLKDLNNFFFNKITDVWLLITKHRLFYILRLLFIVFLFYKPVLVDLDSVYWLGSTVFYFFANMLFYLSGFLVPGIIGFTSMATFKIFIGITLLPGYFVVKRWFKRRRLKFFKRKKRHKFTPGDDALISIFKWLHQLFTYNFYYLALYLIFFLVTVIPIIYLYLSEINPIFTTKLLFKLYFSSYSIYFLPFSYTFSYINSFSCFSNLFIFYKFCFFSVPFLFYYAITMVVLFFHLPFPFSCYYLVFVLSFIYTYLTGIYEIFITSLSILFALGQGLGTDFFTLKKFYLITDIFKNFLFSDNYLSFISMVLAHLFKVVASVLSSFLTWLLHFFAVIARFVFGATLFNVLSVNLDIAWSYIVLFFYNALIYLLQWFLNLYNLYFSEVSVFGLFSTWYEYLNNNVQRASSKNSLINWMFLHIYLTIIAFWILDFDFRVSAKSPPKTPYKLLEEAKRTYDWIPPDMDFGSMQTNHTAIYFTLLEISFEHVESLQFIYGDFEYVDEEFDHEDDTPDEEEYWNDIQETATVRDIIDSDILEGKKNPNRSYSWMNPINSKTSYERHYLTEIVGEPELTAIEPELKYMYEAVYSPSFEELHFKDSLFSEWVFDPDEDLTLFEVLIFFPLFLYFMYVWFYHRRRRKHYKLWLRFMAPTRRTAYSGTYVEDLLGISLGDYGRKIFDYMRKYKAPEVRIKNLYKLRLQRNNQRLKLLQLESFFFEKTRRKMYKKALKEWEKGLHISVEFLVPRRRLPQYYTGIKNLKMEIKTWAGLGDWVKFDQYSGEHKYKGGLQRYEHYQYDLSDLLDMYLMKMARIRKKKRYLWRTINKLPGHNYTAAQAKYWHSRFANTELFFPNRKMKYNYNYYNYIGWRNNRSLWRRYAFTPGNVTNRIWALNRFVPEDSYKSFRWHQKKKE